MSYFPLFTNLNNRPVLLVGAGEVATRKAESLLQAGALIRVVARTLAPAFLAWEKERRIQWLGHEFQPAHLQDVFLVISATGDADVDARVFAAAEARHVLCNTVDDPARCSAIVPAVIDRSPVQVAITSGGTSPVLARHWRQKIEAMLPQHTGAMARIAGHWRTRVKQTLESPRARRRFWESLFASRFDALVAQGRHQEAEAALQQLLHQHGRTAASGDLTIVDIASDDPGLLSLDALRALQAADIVLHDPGLADSLYPQLRKDAGKVALPTPAVVHATAHPVQHQWSTPLDAPLAPHSPFLERRLLQEARLGKRVVWLRGGTASLQRNLLAIQQATQLDRLDQALRHEGIPCRHVSCALPAGQPPAPAAAAGPADSVAKTQRPERKVA